MTDRKKLIKLLSVPIFPRLDADPAEVVADYLLDNGVTVQKKGHIIERIEDGRMKRSFSCCGEDCTQLTAWYAPLFCPNCGAKMETADAENN